ncbi:MAG: YkgJ family cysteine cluster protein [Amphritea sp.]
MECRSGCAACCIAPHISSPLPGMPHGKPAGVHCINLDENLGCVIWNTEHYPAVCSAFKPAFEHCASSQDDALQILTLLETETCPGV